VLECLGFRQAPTQEGMVGYWNLISLEAPTDEVDGFESVVDGAH
jgi:hypothetical protein